MRKKKTSREQAERNFQYQLDSLKPLIKDRYPDVAKITVLVNFQDGDDASKKFSGDTHDITPDQQTIFRVSCPYHECVSGGFDLSSPVHKMVSSGITKTDGTLICQGWQDAERVNRHQCMLKLHYEIQIEYRA